MIERPASTIPQTLVYFFLGMMHPSTGDPGMIALLLCEHLLEQVGDPGGGVLADLFFLCGQH